MSESPNLPPESNKEQPKVEYNEHNSILVKDIIIAIVRTEAGPMIHSRFQSRQEMTNIMVNVNMEIANKIAAHDIEARKSHIVPAKGGIMGFARKVFNK